MKVKHITLLCILNALACIRLKWWSIYRPTLTLKDGLRCFIGACNINEWVSEYHLPYQIKLNRIHMIWKMQSGHGDTLLNSTCWSQLQIYYVRWGGNLPNLSKWDERFESDLLHHPWTVVQSCPLSTFVTHKPMLTPWHNNHYVSDNTNAIIVWYRRDDEAGKEEMMRKVCGGEMTGKVWGG